MYLTVLVVDTASCCCCCRCTHNTAALSCCCHCQAAHQHRMRTTRQPEQQSTKRTTVMRPMTQALQRTATYSTHCHMHPTRCHSSSCIHSARCRPSMSRLVLLRCRRTLCVVATDSGLWRWASLCVVSVSGTSGREGRQTRLAGRARRRRRGTGQLRRSQPGPLQDTTKAVDNHTHHTHLQPAVEDNNSARSNQHTGPLLPQPPLHSQHRPHSRHQRRRHSSRTRHPQRTGRSGRQGRLRAVSERASRSMERVDRTVLGRGGAGSRHVGLGRRSGVVGRSTWPSRC